MVVFPPCKINLGLHVLSKRSDGYHSIETCFYPVPWTDILEVIPSSKFRFTSSGIKIAGQEKDNLCVKAYELLSVRENIDPVQIHLHKVLPSGAGLGGGSSDGASTLTAIDKIFSLGLGVDKLRAYATELGSDCPFFVEAVPAIATHRGDILEPLPISLRGKFLVIITPPVFVSTAEAYGKVIPMQPAMPLKEVLRKDVSDWRNYLKNDFEASLFPEHPVLNTIKTKLYARGAAYSSMSGSGSAVFGLFERPVQLAREFNGCQCWSGELSN